MASETKDEPAKSAISHVEPPHALASNKILPCKDSEAGINEPLRLAETSAGAVGSSAISMSDKKSLSRGGGNGSKKWHQRDLFGETVASRIYAFIMSMISTGGSVAAVILPIM